MVYIHNAIACTLDPSGKFLYDLWLFQNMEKAFTDLFTYSYFPDVSFIFSKQAGKIYLPNNPIYYYPWNDWMGKF